MINEYLLRYIFAGLFVSIYSFIILTITNSSNFIFVLSFVEISSHLIRKLLFEKYVYKQVRHKSPKNKLIKYIKSILPAYIVNVILYISIPLNNSILNSLRVILISSVIGFLSSRYFYLNKK